MTGGGAPGLRVERLAVRLGSRTVVDDVSFEAVAGEITVILGPNGAGKTTLLETIAGLRRSSTGSVHVEGRRLERFRDHARAIAFLPDAGRLPPETNVRTLVDHAASLASGAAPKAALYDGLSIEPLLGRAVGSLSRGEHQRTALFVTLILGRPVVLLDEPFSAFDPLQLRKVLAVVREVARASAVVASIHQVGDAQKVADRVLLLSEGRAVAFGDPATLAAMAGRPSASLEETFVALLSGSRRAS